MTTALAAETQQTVAELKGSSYTLTALKLRSADSALVAAFVREQIQKAPAFFSGAPMVIDCSLLEDQSCIVDVAGTLRDEGLVVVGVQGLDEDNHGYAESAGLAVLRISAGASRPRAERSKPVVKTAVQETAAVPTRVVSQPVRSGQQIYAKGGDLVVLAAVNRDAEVIADGHIHVWGPLRGKALAGASGDESACIFARGLDAQLVSVAGNYRVLDELADDLKGRDVKVSLDGGAIQIDTI